MTAPTMGLMVTVSGSYRTTATTTITQEADGIDDGRPLLDAQVPDGLDIIEVAVKKTETGMLLTGTLRDNTPTPIRAEGATYEEARDALRAQIPDGHRLLGIRIE